MSILRILKPNPLRALGNLLVFTASPLAASYYLRCLALPANGYWFQYEQGWVLVGALLVVSVGVLFSLLSDEVLEIDKESLNINIRSGPLSVGIRKISGGKFEKVILKQYSYKVTQKNRVTGDFSSYTETDYRICLANSTKELELEIYRKHDRPEATIRAESLARTLKIELYLVSASDRKEEEKPRIVVVRSDTKTFSPKKYSRLGLVSSYSLAAISAIFSFAILFFNEKISQPKILEIGSMVLTGCLTPMVLLVWLIKLSGRIKT